MAGGSTLRFVFLLAVCAATVATVGAVSSDKIVFYESFDTDFKDRWIVSESSDYNGVWKHAPGKGTEDYGLLVSEKAKKYGIASSLPEAVDPKADTVVLQYEVRLQNGIECGGAYLKFLMPQEEGWTPSQLRDNTPYSVMFGPDKCGATNKVHFIFRHKDPKTGEYKEHHLKNPPIPITDKVSHVYTAEIHPNNTLRILIDGVEKSNVDLLSNAFEPPVLPPKTIPDKDDKKPDDWDERKKIPDPEASKPEDWDEDAPREIVDEDAVKPDGWLDDEPLEIDDPEAIKPEDWSDEDDGEWEPPRVPNPKCDLAPGCGEWTKPKKKNPAFKGKWKAPLIDNPNYKGIWKPREIPNPEYFELERPNLEPVAAVAIEIWTMSDGMLFDNILVTHDAAAAEEYRTTAFEAKKKLEEEAEKVEKAKEEEEQKKAAKSKAKDPVKGKFNLREFVFDLLYKVADIPFLKDYSEQITDAVSKFEESPQAQYSALAVLALVSVITIYFLLSIVKPSKSKKVTVEQAKKEDITSPDDEPTEEATEGDEVAASTSEAVGQAEAEKEADNAGNAEVIDEVIEEESDKGEEKVRRRTRRDN